MPETAARTTAPIIIVPTDSDNDSDIELITVKKRDKGKQRAVSISSDEQDTNTAADPSSQRMRYDVDAVLAKALQEEEYRQTEEHQKFKSEEEEAKWIQDANGTGIQEAGHRRANANGPRDDRDRPLCGGGRSRSRSPIRRSTGPPPTRHPRRNAYFAKMKRVASEPSSRASSVGSRTTSSSRATTAKRENSRQCKVKIERR